MTRAAAAAVLCGAVSPVALAGSAQVLPNIDITSAPLPDGAVAPVQMSRADLSAYRTGTSDTAAALRAVPGVAVYSGGGFSGLPSIRGLTGRRLSILVDGAPIDTACANDMNPPLSYTDPQTVDAISVITGVSPVSLGGDSIGGVIAIETSTPRFARPGATLLTGEASAFYRSNGDAFGGAISVTAASDSLSLTYDGSYTESGNYKGGGTRGEVRSTEYAKTDHTLALAAQTGVGLVELKGGYHHSPYEGFANQYMDMTSNRSWFASGRWRGVFDWGDVEASGFFRDVRHRMNFLADKGGTANGGMPMNTDSQSWGAGLKAEIPASSRDTLRLGGEFRRQTLDDVWPAVPGSHMMGPDDYVNINDGTRDRLGVYAEWQAAWSPRLTTLLGARTDFVWMNAGPVQPYGSGMMNRADAEAAAAFNAADRSKRDANWGLSALVRYALNDAATLEAGYARKTRSPGLYERYSWGRTSMASRMIGWYGDGNGYVGNLDLKPESADTVSAAVTFAGGGEHGWQLRVAPHYTRVDNYIDAVRIADLSSTVVQLQFRNQDAEFYGVDVSGQLPLWASATAGTAHLKAVASWVRGKNLDDGGPLYHQMPVNATLTLEHRLGGWESAAEVELVADKTRVDATRNEPKTDGYALVNLSTGYAWRMFRLTFEVQNLFDTGYDLPLGGMSIGDWKAEGLWRPVPGRGRSFNVGLTAKF